MKGACGHGLRQGGPALERYIAIDLETSGLRPESDEILQIGAVRVIAGQERDAFNSLVRPERPVSLAILRYTGLTAAALAQAPPLPEAIQHLAAWLAEEQAPLFAYNAAFDGAFLAQASRRTGTTLPTPLDALLLARLCFPLARSHSLATLCQACGVTLERAHDARGDARMLARLVGLMHEQLRSANSKTLARWVQFLREARDPLAAVLESYLQQAPLFVAAPGTRAVEESEGETSPAHAGAERTWDRQLARQWLDAGGPVAAALPNYQVRHGQLAMADAVAEALSAGQILACEAGTGTGKSMAYLVPAILWARSQGTRVVISTHTTTLQEQLAEKDLPLLEAALPVTFRTAVLKGQSHYLCLRRWSELQQEPGGTRTPAQALFWARLSAWVDATATGDRSELRLGGPEETWWYQTTIEDHACNGRECAFFSNCFLFQARRRAQEADLVIVNHALLLSDAQTGHRILPEYRYFVCDEAHHLERLAIDHLGIQVGQSSVARLLSALDREAQSLHLGLLPRLRRALRLQPGQALSEQETEWNQELTAAGEAVREAQTRLREGFQQLEAWSQRRAQRRLPPPPSSPADAAMAALSQALTVAAQNLTKLAMQLEEAGMPLAEGLGRELERTVDRLRQEARQIKTWLEPPPAWVTWVEWQEGGGVLKGAPLEIGPLFYETVVDSLEAAVFTSATLAVGQDFNFAVEGLGLKAAADRLVTYIAESPFHYRDQALLAVPTDHPSPRGLETEAYLAETASLVTQIAILIGGGVLVLFTSHRALREVYQRTAPALEAAGIVLLGQGLDGSRTGLVDRLRRDARTVLFGASSMWEGIDVAGDALRCVIVARLPFRPPDSPYDEARDEFLRGLGRDPFTTRSLPDAVLRFKQGFGRLIRSAEDQGAVVVLDPRLVTTGYGRAFLNALPGPRLVAGNREAVLAALGKWLPQDMKASG